MAGGAGEGCLKVLMWSVMGVLALFAVASAIVYASCHGFMRP